MRYAFAPLPAVAGGDPYFLFDPRTGRALLDRIETAGYETALLDAGAGVIDNIDVVAFAARWNTALDLVMPHWTGTYSPVWPRTTLRRSTPIATAGCRCC
jgi:hypothetical protein